MLEWSMWSRGLKQRTEWVRVVVGWRVGGVRPLWHSVPKPTQVKVPKGTKARDVVCVISKGHLMLKLKGAEEALLDGDFPLDARNGQEVWEKVRADECYWNLSDAEDGALVSIYLEKEREAWWKAALHGEDEIDTTQVRGAAAGVVWSHGDGEGADGDGRGRGGGGFGVQWIMRQEYRAGRGGYTAEG